MCLIPEWTKKHSVRLYKFLMDCIHEMLVARFCLNYVFQIRISLVFIRYFVFRTELNRDTLFHQFLMAKHFSSLASILQMSPPHPACLGKGTILKALFEVSNSLMSFYWQCILPASVLWKWQSICKIHLLIFIHQELTDLNWNLPGWSHRRVSLEKQSTLKHVRQVSLHRRTANIWQRSLLHKQESQKDLEEQIFPSGVLLNFDIFQELNNNHKMEPWSVFLKWVKNKKKWHCDLTCSFAWG